MLHFLLPSRGHGWRKRIRPAYSISQMLLTLLIGMACLTSLRGQEFQPGTTYHGSSGYIEYLAGEVPLIISVPHGGRLEPVDIPDRDCEGCVYVQDSYTLELAREIGAAYIRQTGCHPHIVYNLLHRKKLDMNRDVVEATDSNETSAVYWNDYQGFVNAAKDSILARFGKGLFIDLHGHGHTKQRIEYGYLLYGSQLRESDSMLNTVKRIQTSSIRSLVSTNRRNHSHAELLRGDLALGTMFADRGFPGVPSRQDPFPLADDAYFNGGYNTVAHGSKPGGSIDAIQMELYSAIRFNTAQRAAFADAFATVLRRYLEEHYFESFVQSSCSVTSTLNMKQANIKVAPDPASDVITVWLDDDVGMEHRLHIVDLLGRTLITHSSATLPVQLDVRALAPGTYSLQVVTPTATAAHTQPILIVR